MQITLFPGTEADIRLPMINYTGMMEIVVHAGHPVFTDVSCRQVLKKMDMGLVLWSAILIMMDGRIFM